MPAWEPWWRRRAPHRRFFGAPPGYVGYEEAGQLTEAIRRKPYSIVLLDEIEKAHPDVFNILLQILDDGRLTDGQGRTIDFRKTVLIMTSNRGRSDPSSGARPIGPSFEELKDELMDLLRDHFRPEFLNRIDEIIVFTALGKAQVLDITRLLLDKVARRLKAQHITVTFSDQAVELVADRGYDPEFRARPLRRTIQRPVENELSNMLLMDVLALATPVQIGVKRGKLQFDAKRGDGMKEEDSISLAEEAPSRT